MTTPDYPDWTQQSADVERVGLLDTAGVVYNSGFGGGPYDVSRWKSLDMFVVPALGVAGDRYTLTVGWAVGNQTIDTDSFSFHSRASYDGPPYLGLALRMPMRAPSMAFTLNGPGGGSAAFTMIPSTRNVETVRVKSLSNANDGRHLVSAGTQAVAAGGSIGPFRIPPVARALDFRIGGAGAFFTYTLRGVYYNGAAPATALLWDTGPTATNVAVNGLEVACVATELTITNNDAAIHNANLEVWDVS